MWNVEINAIIIIIIIKARFTILTKTHITIAISLKTITWLFLGLLLSPTVSPLKKAVCRKVATALVGMI